MHGGWLHLLLNCWAIYVFGRELEDALGRGRFLALYFASGVIGGLFQALIGVLLGGVFAAPVVGASAGAFGLVAAFATLFPERPLMLLLFALILRGVAFEFRGKVDSARWRATWDACLVAGSFLPGLLLGVAFANIFQGLPLDAAGLFHGNLLTLLNPYGLLGGVLFVVIFAVHGALWLTTHTEGELRARAGRMATSLWWAEAVTAVAFLALTWFSTRLWQNVLARPLLLILPLLAVAGLLSLRVFAAKGAW